MDIPRPLRCALVGCGNRARDYYAKLLGALPDVELVACVSRSQASAATLAEPAGAAAYDDLDTMLAACAPDFVVLAVPYHDNGRMGLELVRRGVHYLGETPVAHILADGDTIVREAAERGVRVGIAEQFPRFPMEALMRAVLDTGALGAIRHVASDFAGHGYHGTALIRHAVGWHDRPTQALGIQRHTEVAPHFSRIEGRFGRDRERWDFGTLEFASGAFASFVFTDNGYDSPMRWHREIRWFAERGMRVNDRITVLDAEGREPHELPVRWDTHEVDGQTVVRALGITLPEWAAGTHAGREVVWRNPCPSLALRDDEIAVASCIREMVEALRVGRSPAYDAAQGLLDQECTLAMERAHERGGGPCPFPLERP